VEKLLTEYKILKRKLVNPGFEENTDEVLWNECIFEGMDNLLEGVDENTAKLIRLGHI
jgi:hypothetical protein